MRTERVILFKLKTNLYLFLKFVSINIKLKNQYIASIINENWLLTDRIIIEVRER